MRYGLRTLFIIVTLIAFGISVTNIGYRRAYCELRGGIWVQFSNDFGIAYTWPAKGFDRKYCSQLSLSYPGGFVEFPENCCRYRYESVQTAQPSESLTEN